jgi:RNA polymerase sigma-70 factor (ECF subfamily)
MSSVHLDFAPVESLAVDLNTIEASPCRDSVERQYEDLLNEYGPALSRLAVCYESLPQAREDLLQEIRLALWAALPKFRGECSWRTFVYRIAHNRSLTHIWRRRGLPQQLEEAPVVVDPRADPESSAIQSDARSGLLNAVRALPVPYRQVIMLVLEDLTRAEISAVLGTSEGSVAVRLNRARKMLREKLG